MRHLLSEVLKNISPSTREVREEKKLASDLIKEIRKKTPKDSEVVLLGSVAKETFLKGSNDMDIFILLKRKRTKKQLEEIVRKIAKPYDHKIAYAEHPYAQVYTKGRKVDIVPAYKLKDIKQKMSSVDRSPLHTIYIKKNMKNKPDVLLLKKFLKCNGLYGAEIKIEGFSGYLCELLILRHKSFVNLVKNAAKWKGMVFIDLKKKYNKNEISIISNTFKSIFIVIDPTDPNRNVAAAVSHEKFGEFISLCKRFVKKPSKLFFFRKPKTFEERTDGFENCYVVTVKKPDILDDILWGQLKKLERQLIQFLENKEFRIKKTLLDDSKDIRIAIVFDSLKLSKTRIISGPPLGYKDNELNFRKAHEKKKIFVKDNKLFAIVPREITYAEKALEMFFKEHQLPSYFTKKDIWIKLNK